jgi:hypothetical protein
MGRKKEIERNPATAYYNTVAQQEEPLLCSIAILFLNMINRPAEKDQ